MRVVDAILQARTKSARLPGKVIAPVLGRPMLSLIAERLRRCETIRRVVVATSTEAADDAIQAVCDADGVAVFRGSEADVLDRIYLCARRFGMDAIARFTGDNPLIDPAVADRVISFFLDHPAEFDYVSNNHPPSWPDGFEVEVVSFAALEKAWRESTEPFQREHGTPYIWDQPGVFRIGNVVLPDDHLFRQMRWTLDHPEDYEFIRRVYEELYPTKPAFDMDDVLQLLARRPEIQRLNAHLGGESWYQQHFARLRTVSPDILRRASG